MSIKLIDTTWTAIDEGDFLPDPKYRRFIRVGILTYHPPLRVERTFWAFIDRKEATFYIEEEDSHGLKVVEPEELHQDLWGKCHESGLLDIILPYEDPPLIWSDRESSLELARKKYLEGCTWQKAESAHG